MNISSKGIKTLLEHIEETISQDEQERIFQTGNSDLYEIDVCDWLLWKLNLKLENVFDFFILGANYGNNKDFSIAEKDMNELVDHINNTLSVERRNEVFGKHSRITSSDVGRYLSIYLDASVSSEFGFNDFERYISF